MKKTILLCVLIIVIAAPFCSAMGLLTTNLRDTLFFKPNLEKTYSHRFIANCGFTQDYETYVRMYDPTVAANLTEYITIEPSYFKDIPHGATPPFKVRLKLPEKIDKAGIHEIRVGVRETQTWGGGNIGSRTGAEATIKVIVLYPYKYVQWSFQTSNANINETARFKVRVQNFGEPFIKNAKATIKLYDTEDKIIKTVYTNSKSINSTESVDLFADVSTIGMTAGEYKAVAILDYDGNKSQKDGKFLIGKLDVNLISYTDKFYENSTQKMNIIVQSRWNSKIENLYADVDVLDENKNIIEGYSFRTSPDVLDAWKSKEIKGYFENFGLKQGNYTISISLHFDGKTKTEMGNIEIVEAPEPEKEEISFMSALTNKTVLISIIIVLLIANIVWFVLKRKKDES
jgi:hypothetical protein